MKQNQHVSTPELLAPAGDMERLEAAVRFGADAVYLGGEAFGMRAASAYFNPERLHEACRYAHARGVKVYLTCNTLPRSGELEQLPDFLYTCRDCGVDALIVTDLGVLSIAKRCVPDLEIHISTQAGIVNDEAAKVFYEMGAKRVVLARELTFEEIARIRDKTPPALEIECFVHGAMCMSFSGRCLLSNYMVDRDANRGECAQPCRWNYHLMEEKRPGQFFPVFEDDSGSYILNAKDLCMIEHIDRLVDCGISSFKIEGRAKSAYYVAVVVGAYRRAIDDYLRDPQRFKLAPWLLDEVCKVSHRQYSTGFYFGRPEQGQFYQNGGYVREWDIVASVLSCAGEKVRCMQKTRFFNGDEVEILEPGGIPFTVTVHGLCNEQGEPIPVANHPHSIVSFDAGRPVAEGAIVRKAKEAAAQNRP